MEETNMCQDYIPLLTIIPDSDCGRWAAAVQKWLANECKCHTITKVKVTIGKRTYYGCRYIDPKHVDPAPRIYLIGFRPKHRRKTCYMINGKDWYVAGYYDQTNLSADGWLFWPWRFGDFGRKYHPFGSNFILMPWTCDDPIDMGSRTTYDRVEVEVEEFD